MPGFSATDICIYAHFPLSSVDGHFVGLCGFFSTYIPTTTIRSVATKKSLLLPPQRYSRYSNCTKVQTPLQLCCSSGSGGFCWKEKMQKKAVAVCNSAQWNKIQKKYYSRSDLFKFSNYSFVPFGKAYLNICLCFGYTDICRQSRC